MNLEHDDSFPAWLSYYEVLPQVEIVLPDYYLFGIIRYFLVVTMRDKIWCPNLEVVNHGKRFLVLYIFI